MGVDDPMMIIACPLCGPPRVYAANDGGKSELFDHLNDEHSKSDLELAES
jgi:hypothetical protein